MEQILDWFLTISFSFVTTGDAIYQFVQENPLKIHKNQRLWVRMKLKTEINVPKKGSDTSKIKCKSSENPIFGWKFVYASRTKPSRNSDFFLQPKGEALSFFTFQQKQFSFKSRREETEDSDERKLGMRCIYREAGRTKP